MCCLRCKVNGLSHILCNNEGVILAACGMNVLLKKWSATLAFHCTHKAIASGAIELQHIAGEHNWSDFLTKTVDNTKFMACTKAQLDPYSKSMNS